MKLLVFSLLIFHSAVGYNQELPAFKPLRYDEDYSFLKSDTNLSFYKQLKFVRLTKSASSYLSIGGEMRYQYFNIKNEDWGDALKDKDGFVLSRFLAHSSLHLGSNIRLFTQLQGSLANGKTSATSPVDENPLDLHQAFLDLTTSSKKATLRIGRQELSYGSQRLVSVRELPNNRQAFDAARVIFSLHNLRLDVFHSRFVTVRKGIFDDLSDRAINFWGAYLVKNKLPALQNIDLYYLGVNKNIALFNDGSGKEVRHSLGSRVWNNSKRWKYDFEALYQFGSFGEKEISAWTISSNSSYKFSKWGLSPEIGLKTEIISGDQHVGDNKLQTFNPLFPKGAYFGLAALIGPANLFDFHPSLSFDLVREELSWTVDYDLFWRQSLNDGIYAPNVALIYPSGNSSNRHIGNQLATDLTFTPNKFLLLRIQATWFKPGEYLTDVSSGKDILFVGVTSQLKF